MFFLPFTLFLNVLFFISFFNSIFCSFRTCINLVFSKLNIFISNVLFIFYSFFHFHFCLLTKQLRVQSPSWETDCLSTVQQISCLVLKLNAYCRVHKSPPLVQIRAKLNLVNVFPSCFIRSVHFYDGFSSDVFPSLNSKKNFCVVLFSPVSLPPHPWFCHPSDIWRMVQIAIFSGRLLLLVSCLLLIVFYLFDIYFLSVIFLFFLGFVLQELLLFPSFLHVIISSAACIDSVFYIVNFFFVTAYRTDIYVCISAATVFIVSLSSHANVFLPYYTTVLPIFEIIQIKHIMLGIILPRFWRVKIFPLKFS
jgi:hypothetical protein